VRTKNIVLNTIPKEYQQQIKLIKDTKFWKMRYTTEFVGSFKLSKRPTDYQIEFLHRFALTRRMVRDVAKLKQLYKGEYGLNGYYGKQGEYFATVGGDRGQKEDDSTSIIDYNSPPASQPGLWCQWVLSTDKDTLEWNGVKNFCNYIEWLQYLIQHFFAKWDIQLNGEVEWQDEDNDNRGVITVVENVVTTRKLTTTHG
jgi:hypothetical protein